jgi:acetoin utilization protein AcuB
MKRNPVTVSPDATLADAYDLMADNEVRRLPVVTEELVGMVTLSDILGSIPTMRAETDVETRLLLSARKVRNVMAWGPVTIALDDTIQEAAERMLEYQISGLPVIEGGSKVVGVITESDIFRLVVESWSEV